MMMVNKSQIQQKRKSATPKPARKKAPQKDPKRGLADAGERCEVFGSSHRLSEIGKQRLRDLVGKNSTNIGVPLPYIIPPDQHISDRQMFTKEPLKVAIEKFSVSLVSESMLAMVAMHGILAGGIGGLPGDVAVQSIQYARAVMAELKKKEEK